LNLVTFLPGQENVTRSRKSDFGDILVAAKRQNMIYLSHQLGKRSFLCFSAGKMSWLSSHRFGASECHRLSRAAVGGALAKVR
jgi:hypothetical protein